MNTVDKALGILNIHFNETKGFKLKSMQNFIQDIVLLMKAMMCGWQMLGATRTVVGICH